LAARRYNRLGFLVVRVRRFLIRLLGPFLERQSLYNTSNVRVLDRLVQQVFEQAQALDKQSQALELMEEHISNIQARERRHALPAKRGELELDYLELTDRFRGDESTIRERQKAYVERFRDSGDIVDIGCGRGEFLELLRDAGVAALGIDIDPVSVAHCAGKSLEAQRADAVQYLDSLDNDSLGGIFSAQVIEHMAARDVIELVRLSMLKLRPGGLLILETPNPNTLLVFASFHLDFSHIRPYHPEAVKWLLQSFGFEDVTLEFSSPADPSLAVPSLKLGDDETLEEFNRGIQRLNWVLYGFQDYAVVGQKPR
jgi:SAM-dependent methyltransferase